MKIIFFQVTFHNYSEKFFNLRKILLKCGWIMWAHDIENNCLAFHREIEDIDNYLNDQNFKLVSTFTDIDDDGKPNKNSQQRLNDLKISLKKKLPKENQHIFKVRVWGRVSLNH